MYKSKNIIKKVIKEIERNKFKIEKFLYFLKNYKSIVDRTKILNITNLHPYKYKNWSRGVAFFIGDYKNEKVFIKVDTKIKLLENELYAREYLKNELDDYLIEAYDFYKNESIQLAVFPYIDNIVELNKGIIINKTTYVDEILFILKTLHENKIIHRDIKLDNFVLVNDKLKIIDFMFACSHDDDSKLKELNINKKDHFEILEQLGPYRSADYKKDFKWNDFTSMKLIIEEILRDGNLTAESKNKMEEYCQIFNQISIEKTYTYLK